MGNLDSVYTDPTLEAVHLAVEARAAAEPPRTYLGASSAGESCERKLYYRLHGAPSSPRKAKLIYAAEDGHASEAVMAARLRMVPGIELWTHDENGKQFEYTDFDGRHKGHPDGIIRGLLQAPKTLHIWEHKAKNQKYYDDFKRTRDRHGEKQTLGSWDYTYFIQAQLLMGYFDMTRHYLTVSTPGGREFTSCRTEFNKALFDATRRKIERVLDARSLPVRIMDDPAYYLCKMCDFYKHCHGL